jgi:uncharacterized membrane protein
MSIEREVGEIHTKVDHLINMLGEQSDRVSELEADVNSLRRWQAYVIGIFTAVGAGVGGVVGKFFV